MIAKNRILFGLSLLLAGWGSANADEYHLVAKHSGKCFNVFGGGTSNVTQVGQWDCGDGDNDNFILKDAGNGYYTISPAHANNMCLDIDWNRRTANGVSLVIYSCHGNENQQFQLRDMGGGYFQIVSRPGGKCLDVAGFNKDNGAAIHTWDCKAGWDPSKDNQLFRKVLVKQDRMIASSGSPINAITQNQIRDMIVNSYLSAFGRRPNDGELKSWMSLPAGDPRLASPERLRASHLEWLKGQPDEQAQTARRALRDALGDVPGFDHPAVIKSAVTDMMAGRDGGGYRGLLTYLRRPEVRQWYVDLVRRETASASAPAPKPPAPSTGSAGTQTMLAVFPAQGQGSTLMVSVGLANVTPLIGNTGAALANVMPFTLPGGNAFTMPIGNNLTMPIGDNLRVQSVGDDPVVKAFRGALGRDPSREEHAAWSNTRQALKEDGFREILRHPKARPLREAMVATAFGAAACRQPSAAEMERWQGWVGQTGSIYPEVSRAIAESLKQSLPVRRGQHPCGHRATNAVGG